MTARETLAEAHKRMTPEQIAAHALDLAQLVDLYHGMVNERADAMAKAAQMAESHVNSINRLLRDIRALQQLLAAYKKAPARRFLADLAALPPLPLPNFPSAESYRVKPLPPELFNPVEDVSHAE